MTTSAPFRLLIQQRIVAALKTITPGNGYVNDLSDVDGVSRVVRGRGWFGATDPLPLIAMLQPPHPTDPLESPFDSPELAGQWVLILQGFVEDDAANPTDPAEILMADVRKCLSKLRTSTARPPNLLGLGGSTSADTKGTGNSVSDFTIGRGVVRPADERSNKAYFWLLLIAKIAENLESPYGV